MAQAVRESVAASTGRSRRSPKPEGGGGGPQAELAGDSPLAREVGVQELLDTRAHNQETIGRAAKLLDAFRP